jgi:hypothetical protein
MIKAICLLLVTVIDDHKFFFFSGLDGITRLFSPPTLPYKF